MGLHAYPHSIFARDTALKFEVDWHDRYIAVIEAKASKIIASQADSSFGATVFSLCWFGRWVTHPLATRRRRVFID